jgi:hypothetical protein
VRSDRQSPVQAATLVAAMGLYFIAAPIVSFVTGSWWPMILGLGGLLGVVCILVAVRIVLDARRPPTLAEQVSDAIMESIVANPSHFDKDGGRKP